MGSFPQDRKLAQEGLWAHPTEVPEEGGLLLATPSAPVLTEESKMWQLVVCLLQHGPGGSKGLILNRPCAARVGDLPGWGQPEASTPGVSDIIATRA